VVAGRKRKTKTESKMRESIVQAIRTMDKVAKGCNDIGWSASLSFGNTPHDESGLVQSTLIDVDNMAVACRWLESLAETLVADGEPTPLSRSLAVHSSGTARKVGKYSTSPPKSATANVASELFGWLCKVGGDCMECVTIETEDDFPFLRPRFWIRIKSVVESVGEAEQYKMCVPFAETFADHERMPDDMADDAIDELYTFAAKFSADSPHELLTANPGDVIDAEARIKIVDQHDGKAHKNDAKNKLIKIVKELHEKKVNRNEMRTILHRDHGDLLEAYSPSKANDPAFPSDTTLQRMYS
jgi:hypothetical protein